MPLNEIVWVVLTTMLVSNFLLAVALAEKAVSYRDCQERKDELELVKAKLEIAEQQIETKNHAIEAMCIANIAVSKMEDNR